MNIRATLIAISILSAAPAFAEGSVIIFQNGPINWSAVNQYTNHNSVNLNQGGYEGGYSNNYASFAQTGRINVLAGSQGGTENTLNAIQQGRDSYFSAYQSGLNNRIGVTQSRLGRNR